MNVDFLWPNVAVIDGERYKGKRNSTRYIFDLEDKILKSEAYIGQSSSQCETEWLIWNRVKDTPYAKYFAPILEFGHTERFFWCVQEKIPIVHKVFGNKRAKEVRRILRDIEEVIPGIHIDIEAYSQFELDSEDWLNGKKPQQVSYLVNGSFEPAPFCLYDYGAIYHATTEKLRNVLSSQMVLP